MSTPLPHYRVELFDYFGRRVELHRNLTRERAAEIRDSWLDESGQHTAKMSCGALGAPIAS